MRRFRRRFSARSSKKAPLRLSWVTTLFATNVPITSTTFIGQSLLDGLDWEEGIAGSVRKLAYIRRVIVNYTYTPLLDLTQTLEQETGILSAIAVINVDEDDNNFNTTAASTILSTNRIIATNIVGVWSRPGDTDVIGFDTMPTQRVDWKGRLKLQGDEVLTLLHQLQSSMDTSMVSITARGFSRVLIEHP